MPKLGLALAGVLVLVVLVMSPTMYEAWEMQQSFDREFKLYGSAIMTEDYAAAHSFLGSKLQSRISSAELAKIHRDVRNRYGGLRSFEQGKTIVEGAGTPKEWSGITDVTFSYDRGTVIVSFELHYMDGRWMVVGFKGQAN